MLDLERSRDDNAKEHGLIKSIHVTRRRQIVIALVCFLLPLLCAVPLLLRQDVAWENSGLQGIPVDGLTAGQSILYAASHEGIFRSDDGERWQAINTGLPVSVWDGISVHALAADAQDPAVAYALVSDGGDARELYRTTNSGDQWEKTTLPSGTAILDTLTLCPGEPNAIYLLSSQHVYQSTDGGRSWAASGKIPPDVQPQTLALSDCSLDALYLGTQDRGVFYSNDGGQSWQARNVGLESQNIRQLLINPVDDRVLFALADRGIYRSIDEGRSWEFVGRDLVGLNITVMVAHRSQIGTLYVGTAEGQVLMTSDAGETWTALGTNLGGASVMALVLDEEQVRVATNSGLWHFDVGTPPDLKTPSTIVALVPTPMSTDTRRPDAIQIPTASPTATPTRTVAPTVTENPSPTVTATPVPPTFSATATSQPTSEAPTATPTPTNSPAPTNTPVPTNPPATPTSTPVPTNPPAPPTSTPVPTNPPAPPTNTPAPTNPPAPPTSTSAPTNPPVPTSTPVPTNPPATPTNTPVPTDPATPTSTPVPTKPPATPTDALVPTKPPPPAATSTPGRHNPVPTEPYITDEPIKPIPTSASSGLRLDPLSEQPVHTAQPTRQHTKNAMTQIVDHWRQIGTGLDKLHNISFNMAPVGIQPSEKTHIRPGPDT